MDLWSLDLDEQAHICSHNGYNNIYHSMILHVRNIYLSKLNFQSQSRSYPVVLDLDNILFLLETV